MLLINRKEETIWKIKYIAKNVVRKYLKKQVKNIKAIVEVAIMIDKILLAMILI